MKQKVPYVLGAVCSLLFLTVISALTFSFVFYVKQDNDTLRDADTVYVYVTADSNGNTDTEEGADAWLIKEYNEKIGIFDKNGTLIELIDVYTKALPKSDRAELQEGFWINSEKELYSIIEAYSD